MIKYDKQFLINLGNSPQAITTPAHLLINMYNNYIPDYVFRSQYEDTEKPSESDGEKQSPAITGNTVDVPYADVTQTKEEASGDREKLPLNVDGVTIFS